MSFLFLLNFERILRFSLGKIDVMAASQIPSTAVLVTKSIHAGAEASSDTSEVSLVGAVWGRGCGASTKNRHFSKQRNQEKFGARILTAGAKFPTEM